MNRERAQWGTFMLPDRISRLLTAYVDGELTAREREAVTRLLDQSSEAREFLRALQNDADQLRSLPRQTLGPDFAQRVLQTIASRKIEAGRRSSLRMPSYLPLGLSLATAAAVLLLIGLGSYVYIAISRQQRAEVAVRTAQSMLQRAEQGTDQSQPWVQKHISDRHPVSLAPKPEVRERLGPPALQSEAKPAPPAVVSSNQDEKLSAGPKKGLLTSPVRPESRPLKDAEVPVGFTFNLRDLDQATAKQELQQRLQQGAAYRMDLRCSDTLLGVQRLQKALESQGVRCIIDEDAGAFLKLGMGKNPPLALYLENVSAEEMTSLVQQLSDEERKAENRRRGRSLFDILVVKAMTREDQQRVPWELGIDSAHLEPPMAKELVHPDSGKPLSTIASKNGAERLKGQGRGPQTDAGQPLVEKLDRQVLVVAYTPGRRRQTSQELKRFLDGRKECRAGTVQILLVLTPTK